jgi:hypothetical protein
LGTPFYATRTKTKSIFQSDLLEHLFWSSII